MSKLSFRARALDANKTLPVYHEDDVPDLPDMSSVNRVVPQMPTGMEKEEETEHHLQRAISAQQIYGEAQRLIIPTPDVVLYQTDYESLNRPDIQIPKQLIHVQAFTLEDELPNYDCDDDDSAWIDSYNKSKKPVEQITTLEFEKMIDTLEKSCSGSRVDLFTLNDAKLLVKNDNEKLITQVYTYWKEKREKNDGATLMPTVRTEKKEGGALHEPYVAFRRRIEKMQTRKNRKNDEASYEKMLKLRRDLNRACLIMEMVKLREEKKRDLLSTTVKILETRYSNKDFQGELLFQCYDILKQRQQEHTTQQPQNKGHHEERVKRDIAADEGRKRHKLLKHRANLIQQQQQHQRQASETVVPKKEETYTETTIPTVTKTRVEGDITSSDKPDGKYTFKRVKGVVYQAPRYDSMGNWPWTHSVEGGGADSRFCYGCTTLQKKERCIGFARRRRGRGGRMLFDRAYSHYEDYLGESSTLDISSFQDRVPPWPHFRPRHDSTSSEDSDTHTESVTVKPLNWWYRNSNALREQPKGCGNSRPRMHPYSNKTASHTPSINNQLFLASIAANANSKTSSDHLVLNRRNKISTVTRPIVSPMKNAMQIISPSRPPSTAPSSTVYQLNFPIASTNSHVVSSSHNITHCKAAVEKVETSTSSRSSSSQLIVVSSQPQQRQPLSLVQPTAYQKMLQPGSTVQINSFQVQPVPSASRSSKLNISKGLIGTSSVVTNGISSVDSAQLARVRKSLPGFNTLRRSSPEINTTNLPVTVGK